MSKALSKDELIRSLLRKSIGGVPMQIPFAQDIFLCHLHVTGTPYYDARTAKKRLEPGQRLTLRREPGNPHDEMAIEILTAEPLKLGYIPRRLNEIPARLMDAGKKLFLEVKAVKEYNDYIDIAVKLQMADF
ncbi:MAG: HIRAN domain-containing protein [Chloroflexi bacterium]|nr:HIRAN domain-containing protein [Chloroflexota bacterium]